jgi:hypothetical protein
LEVASAITLIESRKYWNTHEELRVPTALNLTDSAARIHLKDFDGCCFVLYHLLIMILMSNLRLEDTIKKGELLLFGDRKELKTGDLGFLSLNGL